MKITHWVPTGSTFVSWRCVVAWMEMELPEGVTRKFVKGKVNNPKYSWNQVCKDFLASDSEWLFSTHDDVEIVPQTLNRLLSWNKPLVSALVFMRQSPVVPHIWKSYKEGERYVQRINDTREWFYKHSEYIRFGPFVMDERPDDALAPVDFTSTSCTLIHRSVLEKMSEVCGDQWFVMDDDLAGGGEDRRFFQIARQVGFEGYVDRSCVVGHLANEIATSSAEFIAWDSISTYENTGEPQPLRTAMQTENNDSP